MTNKEYEKIYVSMTDKFLSGWGLADSKISKFIIICENLEQAETIKKNACMRGDMKNIHICFSKPCYNSNKYFVSYKNFNELGTIWKK